jgi:sodium transport system permease protein
VLHKELLSTLRDRRALTSGLLIPFLLLPIVMVAMPVFMGLLFAREGEAISRIGVVSLARVPVEIVTLVEAENAVLVEVEDALAAVRQDEVRVAFELADDFARQLEDQQLAEITIYSKATELPSELVADKLSDALAGFAQDIIVSRLQAAGVDVAILEPLQIRSVDASTEAEQASGLLSWLIPFFIVIYTFSGGTMVAIDATAGEKERGTLEALLVSPIRRIEVVLGKWLATLLFGLTSAVMALLGYLLGGLVIRLIFADSLAEEGSAVTQAFGGAINISPLALTVLLLSCILLAAMMAALLMSITMLARSFKEAQTYIAPINFLMIFPAIGLQFIGFFELSWWVYTLPIINILLLTDSIVQGSIELIPMLVSWAATLVAIAILLDLAYRNFRREGVLFRT